jgi:phosphoserine phosphatase
LKARYFLAVFDIDGTVYREAMSFIVAEELLTGPEFKEEANTRPIFDDNHQEHLR